MPQRKRTVIVIGAFVIIAAALGVVGWLESRPRQEAAEPLQGRIHIYVDGAFYANVEPTEITELPQDSFEDQEKGRTQQGPRFENVILLYVPQRRLNDDSIISASGTRSSNSEAKNAELTWAQIVAEENHVLLDFASSGDSVKLVSTLPQLDTRDEWVQGLQRIDIVTNP